MKTSSLGDIIQSFPVADYLHRRFPHIAIDWAVSQEYVSLVSSHPFIRNAVAVDFRSWRGAAFSLKRLRQNGYNAVFDLQGNCKSGIVTWAANAPWKVGYALFSVREWPNVLFTNCRFSVSRKQNIRSFYLQLVQQFFQDANPYPISGSLLRLEKEHDAILSEILAQPELNRKMKIMVCPGSKWINKKLPIETWRSFLLKISQQWDAAFILIWGSEAEKRECELIQQALHERSILVGRLEIACWQNLMAKMDLVLAVDSSALHLCGTGKTPSFSIFGPTSSQVFLPLGEQHAAIQGPCPYGKHFSKQCSRLRTCPTGACIRNLNSDAIFSIFREWFEQRF